MKIYLSYSENGNRLINYQELNELKSACDSMPHVQNKMAYIDIENSTQSNPYVNVLMDDALKTSSFHDMKTKNVITINDDISGFYYIGLIIRVVYINSTTARIEFQILPIQTNILNGIDRHYKCLMIKTPHKPTYSNNIAQNIIGETVTHINYATVIDEGLRILQEEPMIMLVINKDLTFAGVINKGINGKIRSGEIIISNPLPPCATRIGGTTLPGFVQFFNTYQDLLAFIKSCYDSNIKVINDIFAKDGKTYQTGKNSAYGANNSTLPMIANYEDMSFLGLGHGVGFLDAAKITKYFIPETINPSDFILCKELPTEVCMSEEPFKMNLKIPIVINDEPYFNLANILQIKCVSSSGQTFTIDSTNILFNDGNPEKGFDCTVIASLTGIDLLIGESSYNINLCTFPDISYSGHSSERLEAINQRSGVLSKASKILSNIKNKGVDLVANFFTGDYDSESSKTYENNPLSKTTIVGSLSASAWKLARFHVETTYLAKATRDRLNETYMHFGYDDYRYEEINLNKIPQGYWQASQIIEVNPKSLNENSFINMAISNGIIDQFSWGIYVK